VSGSARVQKHRPAPRSHARPAFATPLRILQVNSTFDGGGTDRHTVDLCLGLRDLGDDVLLAIPAGSRFEPLVRDQGLRIVTFPPRSWFKNAMLRRLVPLVRAYRPHIIHAHQGRDYWPAIGGARLAGRGTRVVFTRHLMGRPHSLSRWLLLSFGDVAAVSGAVQTVLRRDLHGPAARLHLIPGGIDVGRFPDTRSEAAWRFRRAQGWEEDHVVFGVVSSVNLPRGKGQPEFIDAAARLAPEHPRARFAVVGGGTLLPLLRERVAAFGLQRVVSFIPPTDDVPTVIGALDGLAHPAVGTEALGLVIWEALASGKPVVASRLDGIPEAFIEGEHGLLVPPGDAVALAEALDRFLRDPGLRARCGAAGRVWVCANYSREALARRVRALYLQLLGRRACATPEP
jgi:glycosyltransferase involved in cell wall biosynthesis